MLLSVRLSSARRAVVVSIVAAFVDATRSCLISVVAVVAVAAAAVAAVAVAVAVALG
jgi:hypothetical protein